MAQNYVHKRAVALLRRQKDVAEVAEWYRQGLTLDEVAAKMDRTYAWVWRRKEWAIEAWRKQANRATKDIVAELDSQLLLIQREAVAAWHRSRQPQKRKRIRRRKPTDNTDGDAWMEKETEVKERDGDPRYLDTAQRAIEKRMKLHGVGEERHKLVGADGGPINLFQLLLQAPTQPLTEIGEDGEEHVIEVSSVPMLPSGNGETEGFDDLQ